MTTNLKDSAFGVANVNFNGISLARLVSAAILGGVCVATSRPLRIDPDPVPLPQPFM